MVGRVLTTNHSFQWQEISTGFYLNIRNDKYFHFINLQLGFRDSLLAKGRIAWENAIAAILASPRSGAFTWSYRSSMFIEFTDMLYLLTDVFAVNVITTRISATQTRANVYAWIIPPVMTAHVAKKVSMATRPRGLRTTASHARACLETSVF